MAGIDAEDLALVGLSAAMLAQSRCEICHRAIIVGRKSAELRAGEQRNAQREEHLHGTNTIVSHRRRHPDLLGNTTRDHELLFRPGSVSQFSTGTMERLSSPTGLGITNLRPSDIGDNTENAASDMDECPLYSDPGLYDSLFLSARASSCSMDEAGGSARWPPSDSTSKKPGVAMAACWDWAVARVV